jgi:hypothetical protein
LIDYFFWHATCVVYNTRGISSGQHFDKGKHMSIVLNFALIVMALVSALAVAAAASSASASASGGELSVAGVEKPAQSEPPAVVIHAAGLQ